MNQTRILSYGCSTAAGRGIAEFWRGLTSGTDHSVSHTAGDSVQAPSARACFFPARQTTAPNPLPNSTRALLGDELRAAWQEASAKLGAERGARLGVILATTKGCLEDWVWQNEGAPMSERDPAQPILDDFLAQSGLKPRISVCVSNACASSLTALWLAEQWLTQDRVDDVWVLACDAIGDFIFRGFRALGALTTERARPFAANRSGLQLGEAAAALYLSRRSVSPGFPKLRGISIDSEGYAVTRPSRSGESLARACREALGETSTNPDLVIAHGTGTAANDQAEDRALASLDRLRGVPVTGTKWSVGHTLGASGALDVIAACEAFRNERSFALAQTESADPSFHCHYLTRGESVSLTPRSALVTSLGFGGVHAAIWVERAA